MTGFVGRFDVDINKIHALERGECGVCFAFKVGVMQAGRAGDLDDFQTGIDADAANQIHR